MQLSILEVMLNEKISCSDEILLAVSKFPEPEKKLIQEVQTICKLPAVNPATSAAGECSFSSQCTASEDVVSIQDGWPHSVEWSQAANRQYLYSYTGVCFPQWEPQEKLQHCRQLQKVATLGRFI